MDDAMRLSSSSSMRASASATTPRSKQAPTSADASSASWSSVSCLTSRSVTESARDASDDRSVQDREERFPGEAEHTVQRVVSDDRSVCEGEEELPDENTTSSAVENQRNQERLAQLRQFTARVVAFTRECIFEFGFENELDCFLRESLAKNAMATKEWLNEVFIEHLEDVAVVVGILRAIAHLEYHEIYPTGPTMAIAALSHRDVEVRECGIRAFENWESPDALAPLRAIRCEEPWLQEYLGEVIADLDKRAEHVVARAKD